MAKIEKLIKQSQDHLEEGETVDAAVLGAYETKIMGQDTIRNGVLMATNRRVVFYAKKVTGYDLESFPYENISSFEQGKGMMGGKVSFFRIGEQSRHEVHKGRRPKRAYDARAGAHGSRWSA